MKKSLISSHSAHHRPRDKLAFHRIFQTSRTNGLMPAFTGESGYTLPGSPEKDRTTAAHTAKQGLPDGAAITTATRTARHETTPAGCQNGVLCRFGIFAREVLEEWMPGTAMPGVPPS